MTATSSWESFSKATDWFKWNCFFLHELGVIVYELRKMAI